MPAQRLSRLISRRSLVALFILAVGCAQQESAKAPSSAPSGDNRSKTATAPAGSAVTSAAPKPDIAVSAQEFVKDLQQDLSAAEKKYRGKLIEVSGIVSGFNWLAPMEPRPFAPADEAPNPLARSIISLQTGGLLVGLRCLAADDEPWARISEGQRIKVRGKWHPPGSAQFPALADCVIVEPGTFTTAVVTAAALAKEFSADRQAFGAKYQDDPIIIVGEIKKRTALFGGPILISLETGSPVLLVCGSYSELFGSLRVGQKVKIFGSYDKRQAEDAKGISFISCLPVNKPTPAR